MALAIPMLFALLAQAEPAPPEPVSPIPEPPPTHAPAPTPVPEAEPVLYRVGLTGGLAYQLTGDVGPKLGYGLGASLARRLVAVGRAQLDVRGQFDYARFATVGTAYAGKTSYQTDRTLSFFQFSALATLTVSAGSLRPWAGAGGGFVMGHLVTAEEAYLPGETKATRPLLVGALGVDVPVRESTLVGLHVAYERMLDAPDFTLQIGSRVQAFGTRMSARIALSYEF